MILNKEGPHLDPPSDNKNWQDDEPAELLDPKNVFWRYPDELEESIQVSVPPFPFSFSSTSNNSVLFLNPLPLPIQNPLTYMYLAEHVQCN